MPWERVNIHLSAPPEYSRLHLVDLLGEAGHDLVHEQASGSSEDLETGIFLLWLAVNASSDDLDAHLVARRELSYALLERFKRVVEDLGEKMLSPESGALADLQRGS